MNENYKHQKTVHPVLANSYIVYFVALLFGLLLDFISPFPIMHGPLFAYMGILAILAGTILVIWAQRSATHLRYKKGEIDHTDFRKGPYFFIRTPTHLGLSLLIFGYGLISNSFFIAIGSVLAHTISQLLFIPKVEKLLEKSYGEHYKNYKKKIKRV